MKDHLKKWRIIAKEVGGIFRYTSAKESVGIQELFVLLGLKCLDPKFVDDGSFLPKTNLARIDDGNKNNSDKNYAVMGLYNIKKVFIT